MKKLLITILVAACALAAKGQDDLLELAGSELEPEDESVEQTFKGTRLINGQSVETRRLGVLDVIISHRFGRLNSGAYEFFGLDETNVRLGVDYGISDRLTAGVGRNSFEKTFDGFLKYAVLRQKRGGAPVSVVGFTSAALKTQKTGNPAGEPDVHSRMAYCYNLIVARKFSPALSLQASPLLIHRNSVFQGQGGNDIFAVGAGGRIKLTKRVSLNAEYFFVPDRGAGSIYKDPFAIGFDIETGGHVFQLHFTNARAMIEKGFVAETTGDFFDGDVHFGFNISRTFQLHE